MAAQETGPEYRTGAAVAANGERSQMIVRQGRLNPEVRREFIGVFRTRFQLRYPCWSSAVLRRAGPSGHSDWRQGWS